MTKLYGILVWLAIGPVGNAQDDPRQADPEISPLLRELIPAYIKEAAVHGIEPALIYKRFRYMNFLRVVDTASQKGSNSVHCNRYRGELQITANASSVGSADYYNQRLYNGLGCILWYMPRLQDITDKDQIMYHREPTRWTMSEAVKKRYFSDVLKSIEYWNLRTRNHLNDY